GVRLARGRGLALSALARPRDAAAVLALTARAAERVGWLVRAASAFHEAGSAAYRGADFPAARQSYERGLAICERRFDRVGAARALGYIGNVYYSLGDHSKALVTFERVFAAQEALGDKVGAAETLVDIGIVDH